MTWLLVIALALGAFALAVFLFDLPRAVWTSLGAILAFGLAGYALQANPDLPAAPKSAATASEDQLFDVVEARREFVSEGEASRADILVTSDAMARRGRYAEAAQLLTRVTREDPQDFEAWLAQGIALTEHADGTLSRASLHAFQRAAMAKPDNLAPGYFIGLSLARQGRLMDARETWADALEQGAGDAAGRDLFVFQLQRIDAAIAATSGQMPPQTNAAPEQFADTP
ncbi:hypothetical protein [Aurantiacibacter gangjinensis]|uniref:Uncharacterized protein n=1 Tax=Aurantiacibacter gangjinensis TaxID=502682 RepID=A0A0G9MUY2_9SPHN|nr:hypothetical protein [Aurantiacibacter gangjinensis]APE28997.1 Cytochrome c heme lyase subunit CcmH [Aurantiacibacter gangjinensis]KLE33108.1 hypothetical protein AAW01_03720 [Aurantiacibacter gangjinensis]